MRPAPSSTSRRRTAARVHGTLFESHRNSIFSARSFFQVGGVEPAHDNDYGFTFSAPLWRGADIFLEGGQARMRGSVNGNALVPLPDERTPLDDRSRHARHRRAIPGRLSRRNCPIAPTSIRARSTPTRRRPSTTTMPASGSARSSASRDRFALRYQFTSQHLLPFELVAGQNPDTDTKAHTARITWERSWNARTTTQSHRRLRPHPLPARSRRRAPSGRWFPSPGLTTLGPLAGIPIDRAQNLFRYGGQARHSRGKHTWTGGFQPAAPPAQRLRDRHPPRLLLVHQRFRPRLDHQPPTGHAQPEHPGDRQRQPRLSQLGHAVLRRRHLAGQPASHAESRTALSRPSPRPPRSTASSGIPYPCDCNNLAPLFGFAYRLPGGWGVLRGGYSVQYGEIYPVTFQQVRFDPPWSSKVVTPQPQPGRIRRAR